MSEQSVKNLNVPILLTIAAIIAVGTFTYNLATRASAFDNAIAANERNIKANRSKLSKVGSIDQGVAVLRTDVAVVKIQIQQIQNLLERIDERQVRQERRDRADINQ